MLYPKGNCFCDPGTTPIAQVNCNNLQHIQSHCNTLQHIATHCNTLAFNLKAKDTSEHGATAIR